MSGPDTGTPVGDHALMALHHGRLPPAERADLQARIARDPAAAAMLADWQAQDRALQALCDPAAQEPVPGRLTAVIAQARRAEGRIEGRDRRQSRPAPRPGAAARLARAAGLVAAGAVLGLALGAWGLRQGWLPGLPAGAPALVAAAGPAPAAAAAHRTFAVEVAHPVEVTAEEDRHLTGWLSKRLGHPIVPPDVSALGFRLMGGRILPAERGTAALLMYEDGTGRRISLYAAPQAGGQTAFRFVEMQGLNGFWWVDGPVGYALMGDVPRDLLRDLATAVYEQLG